MKLELMLLLLWLLLLLMLTLRLQYRWIPRVARMTFRTVIMTNARQGGEVMCLMRKHRKVLVLVEASERK